MSWKAYKKTFSTATMAVAAAILVSCSSTSTPQQPSYDAEKARFGAKYIGRQFISEDAHFQSGWLRLNKAPVNPRDFLQQLANVRAYSRLADTHSTAYSKVTNWIASGANINDLAKYGINTRLMRGEDGYQNVLMTGYYIPVIDASNVRNGEYQYPVHAIPRGNRKYTRAEIYAGALDGRGLELAYSKSMMDNFLMEVQGSGFMRINGQLRHFAYGNKNGYGYTSIGRLLVEDGEIPKEKMSIQAIKQWAARNPSRVQELLERNQSYVYFREDPTLDVKGSAGVPLVALASVASDRSIVPSGSVLLVEMPLIDNHGNWTGEHEMRLMVALDVGGAVKGHHFDLYQGIGDRAGHVAGLMKHYGRVWVLN